MSIWKPLPISEEPTTILYVGMLFKTPEGNIHICGQCYEGRVSSKLLEFSWENLTGKTKSGRVYQIRAYDTPGHDAYYVLGRWLQINNLKETDITWIRKETE